MYFLALPSGLDCQGHHFCQVLPYLPDTKSGQINEYVYKTHFTVQSIRATIADASGRIVDLINENEK